METPLSVIPICPSRKALLLLLSSHDKVPGMNVLYNSLAYSSAARVSGLLMTTLFLASTILPPWAHTSQWHQLLASPVAWPSANPGGFLPLLRPWASLRKPGRSFGNVSKPAAFAALIRYAIFPPAHPIGLPPHPPLPQPHP